MSEVIVIGGGAAGMMAAIAASERGHHVVLLEKNEKLGKKLFITGKGRCNVTNAADMETLFAHVCSNAKFLYSAFYGFDNRAVMELVEKAGCPLKIERGERVFPVSDHSSDVIAALTRILKQNGVEIRLHAEVQELLCKAMPETDGGQHIWGVELADGRKLHADAVIICTGGLSYASTGSTGDGLRFAEETGHKVTECRPSLVPLQIAQDWCRELMGLSLKNVELRMVCGKKECYREQGEMLFTHFGVSGPLVLTASCYLGSVQKKSKKSKGSKNEDSRKYGRTENVGQKSGQTVEELADGTESVQLYIDLKPALSEEQLDKRLLRDFDEQKNKQFKNALGGLFPAKLIPVMVMLSGIDRDKKVNEISKEERKSFVQLIKNLPLTVTGTRPFAEAIITQGGVSVKNINPSTMESKLIKGLYFAGEVLDLDAHTGGFNLQIAWSTGHLAGESI